MQQATNCTEIQYIGSKYLSIFHTWMEWILLWIKTSTDHRGANCVYFNLSMINCLRSLFVYAV